MKIISALGGGGSTFLFRALDQHNYSLFKNFNSYKFKEKLEIRSRAVFIPAYQQFLKLINGYSPKLLVIKRPDAFWTDWSYHPTGIYDPTHKMFHQHLSQHRKYFKATRFTRLCGIKIDLEKILISSLPELVTSFLKELRRVEIEQGITIVVIASHWGEYGILKNLDIKPIYLIRDPFNSLISHSKSIRHHKDYVRRGLDNINSKEWIDNYLEGPHHYWINHAKVALSHPDAVIVRYRYFNKDWKRVDGLPNVISQFRFKHNEIQKILTKDSILYIFDKTKHLCQELKLDVEWVLNI